MPRKIELVPYDTAWPDMFLHEAGFIRAALGPNCLEIHHIGSTAVPGLSAKPVIDMLPVVKDIIEVDAVVEAMQQLGYESKGEFGLPARRFFMKGGDNRNHHVHVFGKNNPEIERHLLFRDWIRTHPVDRAAYQKLKTELAAKFADDPLAYSANKDGLISAIELQAMLRWK